MNCRCREKIIRGGTDQLGADDWVRTMGCEGPLGAGINSALMKKLYASEKKLFYATPVICQFCNFIGRTMPPGLGCGSAPAKCGIYYFIDLAIGLCSSSTQVSVCSLDEITNSYCAKRGLSDTPLVPDLFSCDYELALIKKFLLNFPNSKVAGCSFHFSQNVIKFSKMYVIFYFAPNSFRA